MRKAPNLLNRIKVICPTGKSANSCPVPSQKIFRFAIDPTRIYILAILSHSEGRYANVTDVGAGCDGRGGARDGRCQCGRRSRVVLTPRRWCQACGKYSAGDGGKRARSPGRARRKPLKPLRGECRVFPAYSG